MGVHPLMPVDWDGGGCGAAGLNSLPFSLLTAVSLGSPVIRQDFFRAEFLNVFYQVFRISLPGSSPCMFFDVQLGQTVSCAMQQLLLTPSCLSDHTYC